MPRDVGAVVMWCRQAQSQGLLTGDMCKCRQVAAEISRRYDVSVKRYDIKQFSAKMDDIFETWLMLEHPKAYEVYARESINTPTFNKSDVDENGYITSQSMADLISLIRSSGV